MKFFRRRQAKESTGSKPRRRRSHLILGALGCGLLGFLIGCYLFFPVGALRDRLVAEVAARSAARLQIADLAMHFPVGLNAHKVVVTAPGLPEPVQIASLQLTPSWLSLFGANPGVDLQAELFGGQLTAELHRNGAFAAQGGHLALDMPLGMLKSLSVSTTVREATARGSIPLRAGTASAAQLALDNLQVSGLKAVGGGKDVLRLGAVTAKLSGQGNNFQVDQLAASGGDLSLEGSGSMLLTGSPRTSRLNLALTLKPLPGFDPALRDLLAMFAKPAADGSIRLHLTGSLAAPNLK